MLEGIQAGLARVNAAIHGAMEMGLIGSAQLAGQSLKQDLAAIGDRLRAITAPRSVRIGAGSVLGVAATATSALADEPKATAVAANVTTTVAETAANSAANLSFLDRLKGLVTNGDLGLEAPVSVAIGTVVAPALIVRIAKMRAPVADFKAPKKTEPLKGLDRAVYDFDHPEMRFLVADLREAAAKNDEFDGKVELDRYRGGMERSAVAMGAVAAANLEYLGFRIFGHEVRSVLPIAVTALLSAGLSQNSLRSLGEESGFWAHARVYGPAVTMVTAAAFGVHPFWAIVLGSLEAFIAVQAGNTPIKSRYTARADAYHAEVLALRDELGREFYAGSGRFSHIDLPVPTSNDEAAEIAALKTKYKLDEGGYVTDKILTGDKLALRVTLGSWSPKLTFPGSPEHQAALRVQQETPTVREQSLNFLESHPIERLRLARLGEERQKVVATREQAIRVAKSKDRASK